MSAPAGPGEVTVHGTALVLGEAGILIRGAPGAGKSSLARRILDQAEATGRFARLVSDDRVRLARRGGRVVARTVPAIAGLLEIRGLGLVRVPWEPAAVLRVVVDCSSTADRLPEMEALQTGLLEVLIPAILVGGTADSFGVTWWRLRGLCDTSLTQT